jgi:surfeit locus 1 family protein
MWFQFSARTTITCMILAGLMVRASFWQADRHRNKIAYIEKLEARLLLAPEPITKYSQQTNTNWDDLIHRRLTTDCTYDYSQEIILRNRRLDERPGAYVFTPCKIKDCNQSVLVNRGFVSFTFMNQKERVQLNRPEKAAFTGLVKQSMERKIFSPEDPKVGSGLPRLDAWLRIDTSNIQKQIPYPILPIYLEIIPDNAPLVVKENLIESKSGRDEMFFLAAGTEQKVLGKEEKLDPRYPIAVFDTVIPPGRHLGYIYEWAAMAILTLLIGVVLQMKRTVDIK